jgi:hypothetical protein
MMICLSDGSRLLKASVLKSSLPQSRVVLHAVNDTKMHVPFQYLETRQEFNIELLMTGKITDEPKPTGIIIGMRGGFRKFNEAKRVGIGFWAGMAIMRGMIIGSFVTSELIPEKYTALRY